MKKSLLQIMIISILLILLFSKEGIAQSTKVRGKVIDKESLEPIPFVNISFQGTTIGTSTDFTALPLSKGTSNNSTGNSMDSNSLSFSNVYVCISFGLQ